MCGGVGAGGECDGWSGAGWRCSTCVTAVPAPAQHSPAQPQPSSHCHNYPPDGDHHLTITPAVIPTCTVTRPPPTYHRFSVPDTRPCFYPAFLSLGWYEGVKADIIVQCSVLEENTVLSFPCHAAEHLSINTVVRDNKPTWVLFVGRLCTIDWINSRWERSVKLWYWLSIAETGDRRSEVRTQEIRVSNASSRRFHNHKEGHYEGLLLVESLLD